MKLPLGSKLKCRGVSPCVGTQPSTVSWKVDGSMEQITMLSLPLLDPYRNLPAASTNTSPAPLVPRKPVGSVLKSCCIGVRFPLPSHIYTLNTFPSSLIE